MKIIKLHNISEIYINVEHIDSFYRGREFTTVYVGGSDKAYYHVIETPEEIVKLIEEAEKG